MLQELVLSIQLLDLREDCKKNFKQYLTKIEKSKFENTGPDIDPFTTELFLKLLEEVQKNHK